jgi:carnitine-CoA ligase
MPTRDSPPHTDSLAAELKCAAAQAPDRPFVRTLHGERSFRQMDDESDRVAAGLHALGVRPRDIVSLMLPNGIEFIVVWFALAKLGAAAAPVNTAFHGAALADAIDLAGSRLLVAHASLRGQWQPLLGRARKIERVVVVGGVGACETALAYEALQSAAAPPAPAPDVDFRDPCLLLYTSGTTGRSKAAVLSHRFVLMQAAGVIEGLGLRADDVLYCPYPLFHLDAAVMTVAPALLLRGVAAIGERFSVSGYWDEVRALQATVFDFMGATLTMLWKQPPGPRDREHRARLGWGVPLPAWAPQFEQRFGVRLVELYGSTEVGAILYTPLDEPPRPGSCGKPLPHWRLRLADEHGFEVPVGEVGELLVRPEEPCAIMSGYHGMPEATLAAFGDLWFHTGDLLRRDAQGFYHFVGRRKDIVRRRGENIAAAAVEQAIEAHPDVLASAVFGVPSELGEEDVMACVVRRPGAALTAETLAAHCATRLARFMLPRYIRFVDALPRTPTDKIEKFRLQQTGVTADTWDHERAPAVAGSAPSEDAR